MPLHEAVSYEHNTQHQNGAILPLAKEHHEQNKLAEVSDSILGALKRPKEHQRIATHGIFPAHARLDAAHSYEICEADLKLPC
jgi:hypothetical protein